jgi:hypothetical protein
MPRRSFHLALLAGVILANAPLAAEEAPQVARGTDGLTRVAFTAVNAGSQSIACAAATAHWYSVDFGSAPPGGRISATLWAAPANGEVFVLNDEQDRMPVLSLWCGLAGHSWATRSAVTLARAAGTAPKEISLSCRESGGMLVCR